MRAVLGVKPAAAGVDVAGVAASVDVEANATVVAGFGVLAAVNPTVGVNAVELVPVGTAVDASVTVGVNGAVAAMVATELASIVAVMVCGAAVALFGAPATAIDAVAVSCANPPVGSDPHVADPFQGAAVFQSGVRSPVRSRRLIGSGYT